MSNYFDLSGGHNRNRNVPGGPPPIPVIPQYIAMALGVIVEPFVNDFIETHTFAISWSGVAMQLIFGLIIAVAIFPAVYRNAFDPQKPLFVQLCAIFTAGLGWQSLFSAGGQVPTSVTNGVANTATNTATGLIAVLF